MTDSAVYQKLDFVDYFERFGVPSEAIERFAHDETCLAILDALMHEPMMPLGFAGWMLATNVTWVSNAFGRGTQIREKVTYPYAFVTLLKQAARRAALPQTDSRMVRIPKGLKDRSEYQMFYSPPDHPQGWIGAWNEMSKSHTFGYSREEKHLSNVQSEGGFRYLDYWCIAYRDELDRLLSNFDFLSTICAFMQDKTGADDTYLCDELEQLLPNGVRPLNEQMRARLFLKIRSDIAYGIIRLPETLQSRFSVLRDRLSQERKIVWRDVSERPGTRGAVIHIPDN